MKPLVVCFANTIHNFERVAALQTKYSLRNRIRVSPRPQFFPESKIRCQSTDSKITADLSTSVRGRVRSLHITEGH